MKKFFTVLAAAMMVAVSASAQHEIGAIVGGMNGASYKYWFNDNLALQADLAVGLTRGAWNSNGYSFNEGFYDFTINPNVLYHFGLPANFKIYAGGGVNFGLLSDIENTHSEGILGKFGINGAVGVTYDIQSVPLVLAFDFRPGYGLGFWGEKGYRPSGSLSYFDWKLGFAVRYKL
jgi:hypothetical protein